MSINVTVSGNPVSIKRGKMVTADPDYAKKEFDKRRLMRLEQVRQQSKDIAENVRNKVRKEKKKQLNQIEQEGKDKLKSWQNRKLLELQTQYKEAIKELGVGHKQAVELEDESEILAEEKEHNEEVAEQRSRVAATKLQIQKNEENLKKAIPVQQKKLVRDLENARAALVSNVKKKKKETEELNKKQKKRRRASADINITIPDTSVESQSSEDTRSDSVSQDDLSSTRMEEVPLQDSCDCTADSEQPREPLDLNKNNLASTISSFQPPRTISDRNQTLDSNFAKEGSDRRGLTEKFQQSPTKFSPPLDTRISDRIRRRKLMASLPDYCDIVADTHPMPTLESNTQIRDVIDSRIRADREFVFRSTEDMDRRQCTCGRKCMCGENVIKSSHLSGEKATKQGTESSLKPGETQESHIRRKDITTNQEIPTKPPIKLRQSGNVDKATQYSKVTVGSSDSNKVQFYDHSNRFSHEKQYPSNAYVERITNDSLEVMPNVISEAEWYERMKQRDKEAQIRGQKAMMKEKIQKDYEEMLRKLPLLQKKERILEINKDKPEYHMSEERLKEQERIKKNHLENAYNKKYSNLRPAIVTLPRKIHTKEPTKIPVEEPTQSINVAKWEEDFEPKMFTVEEVQEIVRAFTGQEPKDRQAKLKELLKSLKLQKQQLINEIKSLPKDDSINDLLNDLNSFSDSDEKACHKTKKSHNSERKRRHEGNESSNDSTTESTSSSLKRESKKISKDKQRRGHQFESGKTPSPRKKAKIKSRKNVLILQNMSTQTTPKTVSTESDQGKAAKELPKTDQKILKHICNKLHTPCDCLNEQSTDELCQIVIKLNDNESPEVIVKSKADGKISTIETPKMKDVTPKSIFKSIGVGTDDTKTTKHTSNEVKVTSVKKTQTSETIGQVKKDTRKSKLVSKDETKHTESRSDKGKKLKPAVIETTKDEDRSRSWREQLSKNSASTSSTSYFSPPDFQKIKGSQASSTYIEQTQSFYNLRRKPQQGNIPELSAAFSLSQSQSSTEERNIDPKLLVYIKKLLSSSRVSIENLSVSTSSVQTPSQSIIEMESNNPMAKLHNIIKHFNLRVEDIARELSVSTDSSHIHHNSSASTSDLSQQKTKEKIGDTKDQTSKSTIDRSSKSDVPEKDTSVNTTKSKETILTQYADITDSCSKRIAHLAAMIQQIREEKIQMLKCTSGKNNLDKSKHISPTGSEKDYSTHYLDLPESGESSKQSSGTSLDDEELQRRLMEIDLSLANKLRKFPPLSVETSEHDTTDKTGTGKGTNGNLNNNDKELWMRLHRLMQQSAEASPLSTGTEKAAEKTTPLTAFVPFLSDIPKLPKLEIQPEGVKLDTHKRPPPSKGLTVAKKFNGNISLVPHELSTIAEADSQLSAKVSSRVSPNSSKTSQGISPHKDFELCIMPEEDDVRINSSSSSSTSQEGETKVNDQIQQVPSVSLKEPDIDKEPVEKNNKSKTASPLYLSLKDTSRSLICDDLSGAKSSSASKSLKMSSSSSDDIETIETMLKSIGMGWAVATLRKTQDALALTSSSSSSLELHSKKKLTSNESSGSEVSLREFLRKQMLCKISSSTFKSDASPVSLLGEFSDISAIHANSSAEKGRQRTSTPVTTSKSTSKSRGSGKHVIFSGDSDISSVRDENKKHSDRQSFCSLSENSQSKNDE